MNGFLDWRAIELQSDWGLREKTDAMGDMWDAGADMWDSRWKEDEAFTRRQADALAFEPDDVVLDLGCGTGPLALHVAPRVQKVIAQDYGQHMLAHLQENARERGIDNIDVLQGNWHTMEPGRDLPICDVAITRWSPAQGDILKMSRCARRWCYSLSSCALTFEPGGAANTGFWCRTVDDEEANHSPRPCARKYGVNIHFNLLYDHGANPTISYVRDHRHLEAPTREGLVAQLRPPQGAKGAPGQGGPRHLPTQTVPHGVTDGLPPWIERNVSQDSDGTWHYNEDVIMTILGWDPNEVVL